MKDQADKQLAAAGGAQVGNEKATAVALITAGFWGHRFPGHLHP